MRRTAMLWEAFVPSFEDASEQYQRRRLTAEDAGELSGMSGRNSRRLVVRWDRGPTRPATAKCRRGVRRHESLSECRLLPRALQRLHSEAFPRAACAPAQLQTVLHGNTAVVAGSRAGGESETARCTPHEKRVRRPLLARSWEIEIPRTYLCYLARW
jgi:hypothetical protein